MSSQQVTTSELYDFIIEQREVVNGVLMCRASLWAFLLAQGVEEAKRKALRTRLVKELEERGLVERPHPQSGRLLILDERVPDPLTVTP